MFEAHAPSAVDSLSVGQLLRQLRQQARLSQLELALQAGMSQRHLSCVETGRAQPSPELLHSVLSTLDTPLQTRNRVFLAAGYAPRYAALALNDPGLEPVRMALMHLLKANNRAGHCHRQPLAGTGGQPRNQCPVSAVGVAVAGA